MSKERRVKRLARGPAGVQPFRDKTFHARTAPAKPSCRHARHALLKRCSARESVAATHVRSAREMPRRRHERTALRCRSCACESVPSIHARIARARPKRRHARHALLKRMSARVSVAPTHVRSAREMREQRHTLRAALLFFALAFDKRGAAALLLAITGAALVVLAWLQNVMTVDYVIVSGVLLATWIAVAVFKQFKTR